MTGRISYGKKDWLVFSLCCCKGFFAPRIPPNRVVGMLREVGAFFVNKTVVVFGFLGASDCAHAEDHH
jgi:hypothetical protein